MDLDRRGTPGYTQSKERLGLTVAELLGIPSRGTGLTVEERLGIHSLGTPG